MIENDIRDFTFVSEFQDFYSEVIRMRRLAVNLGSADPVEAQCQSILTRLSDLLERQSLFAGRSAGEIGFGLYCELQYVMAALADETFLQLEWPGREYWSRHLLETRLFDSHNAGEEFFTRMDRLLDQPERSYTDIYSVYLMALALGFRGKYWGVDDDGRIEQYRQRLFVRIYRRRPELFSGHSQLFPESYRYTLSESMAVKLPSPNRWFLALAAAIVIWLVGASLLWHGMTDGVRANIARIQNAREASTR
jgi:type VI secretion system protein ImpK